VIEADRADYNRAKLDHDLIVAITRRDSDNLQQSSYGSGADGGRPHRMAVVEPVTPLAIRTRGRAPMAPLGVIIIVTAPPAETMDPIRETLTAPPAEMATKVTAQPAEAMDRIDKSLTAPPLEVVIMTGVRLALMGALRRLHMGG